MSRAKATIVEDEGPDKQLSGGQDWADGAILVADGEDRVYFKCDTGNVCTGTLVGESSYPDSDGRMVGYWVIHTDRPTLVTSKDDKDPHAAPAGSMVYVNKRAQLEGFAEFIGTDEVVWVGFEPKKKTSIKGGRTVWNFKVAIKPTGRKRPKILLGAGQGSEVPF